MAALGKPALAMANSSGSILLARSDFEPFEGSYGTTPFLMLTLCLSHSGHFRRKGEAQHVEGILRPGTFAFALPNTTAEGYWPRVEMLGIAVDLTQWSMPDGSTLTPEALTPAAGFLHSDPLITSVMTALWHDAESHGLSSAFFEHGLCVILKRLASFSQPALAERPIGAMSVQRLARAFEFIESRLGSDVRMEELARELGQEIRTVTRAFRAATGLAPFEYLTVRRMEKAKQLLLTGIEVTAIANEVGYSNPSKFAAAFRRVCGCSPTDWRRRKQAG